jgi:hypothetical protein
MVKDVIFIIVRGQGTSPSVLAAYSQRMHVGQRGGWEDDYYNRNNECRDDEVEKRKSRV